mgnify:FL=1
MAATLKYNLKQITDISYTGFHFEIPEDTFDIINYLCEQVGSSGISSSVFEKLAPSVSTIENTNDFMSSSGANKNNKKK